jgi:exonuclease VII large subunit
LLKLQYGIAGAAESTDLQPAIRTLENAHTQILSKVSAQEELLKSKDPSNLLKLGYSIVQSGGTVIKKIAQIKEGQKVTIRVQDGSFDSEITKLNN